MALEAAILSVIVGLIRRGRVGRLADLNIRWFWLVLVPVAFILISQGGKRFVHAESWVPITGWLHVAATVVLLAFLWANRGLPGMRWLLAGWAANLLPIAANGGKMPVSAWAVNLTHAAKLGPHMSRHAVMSPATHFNFLADLIPVPRPLAIMPGVISPGDVLMAVGVFVLIQLTMCPRKRGDAAGSGG